MSTDCLCEYHGRASRDTLRVWSGWASTVIHWPHYEPDLGPRYAPGRGPRDELDLGPRDALGRRPRNCRTNLSATAPLDLRASGPTAQIHINGHRGPAPLEPSAGVMSRRCWDRTRTRPTGVYTPLDRTTRTALPACTCLDPQPSARDPAGAGGVAWANQGWIGLKAETTAEPSRNGPGPRFGFIGKYRYRRSLPMSRWDLMPFHNRPFKGSETGEVHST